jgi:hypothetical protein
MGNRFVSEENTAVMLKSIITANKELLMKLKSQFQDFSAIQLNTILLLELGYSRNDIRIILGISIESIEETSALLSAKK